MRPEFDKASARLVVISAIDTGAQEFLDAAWPKGELWVDENEAFKFALGGQSIRLWWLLKPSVLRHLFDYAGRFGSGQKDTTDQKTQLLGGTFVVKDGEVTYVHRETTTFDNGDARDVLAAVLGKPIDQMAFDPQMTPAAKDVVPAESCEENCER